MISPEFETDHVRKDLGQQADFSKHGEADRHLAHENGTTAAWRGSVVELRDTASLAQRVPRHHGREHGSTARELRETCLPAKIGRNCC